MEEIICFVLCCLIIVLLKILLKINIKQAKELENNQKLQNITNKFPKNIEMAKEMLEILGNNNVKIEEANGRNTSLYVVVTNKIIIADLKDNYGRIGTIAHECLHSVQDRTLLMFNFIFSNFTIIYWMLSLVLILCNVFTNIIFHMFILLLLFYVQTIIRAYLEIDAMTKSKFLAKEYIESKKLCTEEEKGKLISQYEIINNMGIYFYIYKLIIDSIFKTNILLLIYFLK